MLELLGEQREKLAELFQNAHDTTIWSYLQGHKGRGWVNQIDDVTCGRIIVGTFCFLAGEPKEEEIHEFLMSELEGLEENELIWIPQNKVWENTIKETGHYKQQVRYAFHKDRKQFDHKKLTEYTEQLPGKYQFRRIDEQLYHYLLEDEGTKDFVFNFSSAKEFLEKGIGILVLDGAKIIAGASSYTYYDGGIEIEIATQEEFRRQGLATMVGAKLILECLKEEKYPNWDAANLISVKVAQKLGYQLDMEYPVFIRKTN